MNDFVFTNEQPRRVKTKKNSGIAWLFASLLVAGCMPAFFTGYWRIVLAFFAVDIAVCGWLLVFHRNAVTVSLVAVALCCTFIVASKMQQPQHDTIQQTIDNFHREQEHLQRNRP
jgi:hypothetical protein